MNTTIIKCKKIFVYENQIQRVLKKIKNLKITIKKIVTIITFNNFNFEFEIYLTIINNKTRNNNKLLNFNSLIKVL